ncbi:helix-turn-helix protein [Propionibacteriaceae bacterium ES.041]|nr:helix-turn-helix protein [Propionibacteriaceae bacterium ES.041]
MVAPGAVFARRLREQRRASRMTQTELARRLSALLGTTLDASAITKIESGDRAVRLDEAVYIAQILEMPLAALLSGMDPDEARLQELRHELQIRQWREMAADSELRQAMSAVAEVTQEIERLEASREEQTDDAANQSDDGFR